MKRLRRNFALAATAMVITVAAAELPSSAAGGVGAKANVSSAGTSRAAQSRTRAYWTPARMSHAKAMSMGITQAQAAALGASGAPSIGKPVTVEPTGGRGVQPAPLTSPVPAACCPGAAYAYPAPFTRYGVFPNSQYNVYPYRTNGKIFFTQGAGNFVCSGTVVSSAGHWLVETAGHCVANASTHTFSTNVLFVPAYRSGTAPFGTWSAARLWTSTRLDQQRQSPERPGVHHPGHA
jgi:V8-like Glu-specific endopeptidase